MSSLRVKNEFNKGTYFLTFTVKNFYYLFDRYDRWNILSNSLEYYIKENKIELHAYVFMLNHIHLLIYSENVSQFIQNYKSYNSKVLIQNINLTEPNILKLFPQDKDNYRFWAKTNYPEEVYSEKFYLQKINYIEMNPVKKSYVEKPENWYWSSANVNCVLSKHIKKRYLETMGFIPEV